MNRFALHFTGFVGLASLLAMMAVAGISFACQSARAAMGGEKGSEMRFTPASRPQDGLSHPVNTGRPTGGKSVDLRRATREVAAGSPGFAHSSSVSSVGAIPGTHKPAVFALDGQREPGPSEQGVRSVPGRAVPNEVVLLRDARGHSLQAIAKAAALLCGVDPAFYWSLALRESSGRHWDADGRVLRSKFGAWGLGQIKIATARDVDPRLNIMRPFDNALASACYYRQMLERAKGDERLALVFYHRGPNAKGPTPQASHDYANDIIEGSAN